MLMLKRRSGESICIGEDVEVKVVSVSGSYVHLGVSAPRDVLVMRDDVLHRNGTNMRAMIAAQTRETPDVV